MTHLDWKSFLAQWSRAILASPDVAHFALPPEVIEARWLGYPGASEAQITAVEARLEVTLPPSYRAFLRVSNGWRHTGGSIERVLPVEEIDRMMVMAPEVVNGWMAGWEYFGSHGAEPDTGEVDYRHLAQTLVISGFGEHDSALFLLNPAVKAPDGEWEAWFFADWVPGATRYASFEAMVRSTYASLLETNQREARRIRHDDAPEVVVAKLPDLIALLEEKAALYRAQAVGRNRIEAGYSRSVAEGLDEVAARVRAVRACALAPGSVRDRLRAIAEEFEDRQSENATRPDDLDMDELLRPLFEPTQILAMLRKTAQMLPMIHRGARMEAYRQGAATIRWFLEGH